MTTLQQPRFIQISNSKNNLYALDEEGKVWQYIEYTKYHTNGSYEVDKDRTGWYPTEPKRHATTS